MIWAKSRYNGPIATMMKRWVSLFLSVLHWLRSAFYTFAYILSPIVQLIQGISKRVKREKRVQRVISYIASIFSNFRFQKLHIG